MSTDIPTRWSREAFSGSLRTFKVHPGLVDLARTWPTYRDATTRQYMKQDDFGQSVWVTEVDVPCVRCTDCDDEILVNDPTGRLGHLAQFHGWRMNGKRYDGQNNVLEEL
jgi:hypothetical protein